MRFNQLKQTSAKKCKEKRTQNQIDLPSNKKKLINWKNEEIAVAFTLMYYPKSPTYI